MPKASQTFIVAVAPVCLRAMGRSRDAQRDLHALGLVIQQTPADVEALEVTGRFIGRALLGYCQGYYEPILADVNGVEQNLAALRQQLGFLHEMGLSHYDGRVPQGVPLTLEYPQ